MFNYMAVVSIEQTDWGISQLLNSFFNLGKLTNVLTNLFCLSSRTELYRSLFGQLSPPEEGHGD